MTNLSEQKAALRRQLQQRLRTVTPAERQEASHRICDRLRLLPAWQAAKTVLFFAPLPDEPDLWPLLGHALQNGQQAALPLYLAEQDLYRAAWIRDLEKDVQPGHYGIREPRPGCPQASLFQLDIVLVPGVCFSRDGLRLGRGGGYYDRLLANVRGRKWGVGYDWQVLDHLPSQPHDIQLDGIITPWRWLDLSGHTAGGK